MSFLREQQGKKLEGRKRFGLRFLKPREIEWLTSSPTLRKQTSLSLEDRCRHFREEFPNAKLNYTLLSRIYKMHGIKKKKLRWYKTPPESDLRK